MHQYNFKKISPLALMGVLIPLFLTSSVCFAAQESITLTTYYPAPYGIYRELRADQMAIGEGYRDDALSNGMLIVEDRVGIGTPTPTGVLDVDGGVMPTEEAPIDAEPITIKAQSTSIIRNNNWGGSIILYPGNSDANTDYAGGIAIGLDKPDELLHVKTVATHDNFRDYHDTVAIFESGDAGAYIALKDSGTNGNYMPRVGAIGDDLRFQVGQDDQVTEMTIKDDGRVGIGTVNPIGTFNIAQTTGDVNANSAGFVLTRYGGGTGATGARFEMEDINGNPRTVSQIYGGIEDGYSNPASGNNVKGSLKFFTRNGGVGRGGTSNERMRITYDGDVGIGTSNPEAKLDIVGDGNAIIVPRKSTSGDPAGINGMIYYNNSSNKFRIYENGAWKNLAGGGIKYRSGIAWNNQMIMPIDDFLESECRIMVAAGMPQETDGGYDRARHYGAYYIRFPTIGWLVKLAFRSVRYGTLEPVTAFGPGNEGASYMLICGE